MRVTKDQILGILYQCIDDLNQQRAQEQRLAKVPQTILFGDWERWILSGLSTSLRSSKTSAKAVFGSLNH